MNQNRNLTHYLILSLVGALFIVVITWLVPYDPRTTGIYDRLFVGMAFITSCIIGISLAIKPNWLNNLTKRTSYRNHTKKYSNRTPSRNREGHHPVCNGFHGHTLLINNKVLCAGCWGLAVGAVISIIMMAIYIVYPIVIPISLLQIFFVGGLTFIVINFIETTMTKRIVALHIFTNVLLVISFLSITLATFQLTGNIIVGVISVIISFLWLDTRIQLSNWRHAKVCLKCNEPCKVY